MPICRLPVSHPDYRYNPSRNPYWGKLDELKDAVFTDHDTEIHQGKWAKFFPHPKQPLHVEVGCNTGHVVREWARQNPKANYIGIDYKFKSIYKAWEKREKYKIGNVLFFRAAGERLPYMFGEGEIDGLYLFFPDPWPKKAHWKNRFVTAGRLREIAPLMKKGGIFHIKTDHPGYFDWMEEHIAQVGDIWEATERTRDLHAGHPDPRSLEIPQVTLFERIFIKEGIPIQSVKLVRR